MLRASSLGFTTVHKVRRAARAFTLLEIAIVLGLITVALLLVAVEFGDAEKAGGPRQAQGTAEATIEAALASYQDLGALPTTAAELESYAPGVTFTDAAVASTKPDEASVAFGTNVIVAAVSDGKGSCWVKLRFFEGGRAETNAMAEAGVCSAAATALLSAGSPPSGRGDSWSKPWVLT